MKKIVMKILEKDRPKKRAPILVSQKHKTKVMYKRKPKHKSKSDE